MGKDTEHLLILGAPCTSLFIWHLYLTLGDVHHFTDGLPMLRSEERKRLLHRRRENLTGGYPWALALCTRELNPDGCNPIQT